MHDFRKLQVWKKACELVKAIYKLISKFPKVEVYGLNAQIKRSVISIPSNIAEGCGRNSDAQLKHFLNFSSGSCSELESQIINAYDLEFINKSELTQTIEKIQEVQKMIIGLQRSLKTS